LVARHKKKTLLSKLDSSYLKYFTALLYFFIFTTGNKILLHANIDTVTFLRDQYEDSIKWVFKTGALQIVNSLQYNNYSMSINGASLSEFTVIIEETYLNNFADSSLKGFNLNIMDFENQDLAALYSYVYFQSLCMDANDTTCTSLLNSSINSGVESFNHYVTSTDNISTNDFYLANKNYIEPAILNLIQTE
jgi:hypothetical protein